MSKNTIQKYIDTEEFEQLAHFTERTMGYSSFMMAYVRPRNKEELLWIVLDSRINRGRELLEDYSLRYVRLWNSEALSTLVNSGKSTSIAKWLYQRRDGVWILVCPKTPWREG